MLRLSPRTLPLALLLGWLWLGPARGAEPAATPVRFERDFAPAEGLVRPQDREHIKVMHLATPCAYKRGKVYKGYSGAAPCASVLMIAGAFCWEVGWWGLSTRSQAYRMRFFRLAR